MYKCSFWLDFEAENQGKEVFVFDRDHARLLVVKLLERVSQSLFELEIKIRWCL
jgi:hypothetical protein